MLSVTTIQFKVNLNGMFTIWFATPECCATVTSPAESDHSTAKTDDYWTAGVSCCPLANSLGGQNVLSCLHN